MKVYVTKKNNPMKAMMRVHKPIRKMKKQFALHHFLNIPA
jgi:hypothetical protein